MSPCTDQMLTSFKVAKYTAKLRLLDCGLLEPAHAIDAFIRIMGKTSEQGAKDKNGDESMETEQSDETLHAFRKRLNEFVEVQLESATSRDNYKEGQVYQARKAVINEFLKGTMLKKCNNPSCEW